MFKQALITFLLIFSALGETLGQNQALISEIRGKIKDAKNHEKFSLLNDLAWEYRFSFPDSTIYYSSLAYELGKTIGLEIGLSRPLNYIGVAYDKKGEPINAYDHYNKAFTIAERFSDSLQIGYSQNNLGRLLSDQGIHNKALEYFLKARKVFSALKDSSGLAYVYQSIGRINDSQKDYKNAELNFLIAYKIRVNLGNTRDIMAGLVYLGTALQKSGNNQKALEYLLKADSAGHVINDRINLAEIKVLLAKNYLATGNLDSAQKLSIEGLAVISGQNAKRTLPEALLVRGQVLLRLGNQKEAKRFFTQGLDIATQTKELDVKMDAHYLLWQLAEQQNDNSEKLLHHNQYLIIQDTLKDLEVARSLERFQFENEIQKRELESKLIQARAESTVQKARLQNITLSVVSFFMVLMAFVLWRNNRKKQEINKKLTAQNQKLEELNHEKDTLMNIVAHDLKSPLNRINGLTHLMELDTQPESQKQYIDIIKKTTRAGLTLISDLLDLSAANETSLKPVVKSFDLPALIRNKIESFQEATKVKNIALNLKSISPTDTHTDPDFIERIIENLISNAIKFSEPNSSVEVSYGANKAELFISVKDNGPGFTEKDKAQLFQKFKKLSAQPTANESSNGLGLALIKSLVDRLNGKIELKSEVGKGSEFIITLPNEAI